MCVAQIPIFSCWWVDPNFHWFFIGFSWWNPNVLRCFPWINNAPLKALGFCGTFHVFHARSSRLLIASMAMAMAKANSYSKSHLGDVSSPAVGKLDLAKDESWFKMISSSKSLGVHTYIYTYICIVGKWLLDCFWLPRLRIMTIHGRFLAINQWDSVPVEIWDFTNNIWHSLWLSWFLVMIITMVNVYIAIEMVI